MIQNLLIIMATITIYIIILNVFTDVNKKK